MTSKSGGCCGPPPEPAESETCSRSSQAEEIRSDDYRGYINPNRWTAGSVQTPAGEVPLVSPRLNIRDILGGWRVRWGIRRGHYRVRPGLYGFGSPVPDSPVLVTANYKFSFDKLRKELAGVSAWILVLDTKGINVWCAAGKGTFGTEEIVRSISETRLNECVSHRSLILPQLGAPGVAAHEVRKNSGFQIKYGPVRAKDIPAYFEAGLKADPKMRTVRFNWIDRIVLTPTELTGLSSYALMFLGVLAIFHIAGTRALDPRLLVAALGAVVAGAIIVPALLPWIPGRAFAFKGWLVGWLWTTGWALVHKWFTSAPPPFLLGLAAFLILPSLSAFLAMNFTGSSAYTSLSGVLKEMGTAVPGILVSVTLGIIFLLIVAFRGA